jgi:hypothetical protein
VLTVPWTTTHPAPSAHTCTVIAARLPLISTHTVPAAVIWAWRIRRHLAGTPGLVGHALALEMSGQALWTVSAWSSRTQLLAFDRGDIHQNAKAALRPRLRPATFAVWSCPASDLPLLWPEIRRRIAAAEPDPANA